MTTNVIIDIVAALVLIAFVAGGAKRGLFRALAGLLTIVVALAGAGIIAAALTPPLTKVVTPLLAGHMEQKVESAMAEQAVEMPEADVDESDGGLLDLLSLIGLDDDVRDGLVQDIRDTVHDTGVSVATAVAESLTQTFLYGILFCVSFVALVIALKVATRAMDLVLKLPGLHGLNALGGAVIGLAEGALVLFLAVWVLRRLGVSFESGPAAQTVLFQFFTTHTPLGVLSLLQ
ncbi:CvpA family protein [uncultured Oscillibacter sp.]|uniref:CvpA family protein n=1 Tax=uncultured Oscillibacter sp. TaxID=876091 RepID=UPI0025FAEABA|nr:CvpA family protein [uncultured Oscillibacter sp.]